MPRGHAFNEAEKSRKCRLSALGNINTRGKTWKQVNKTVHKSWFKKGIINYPNKKIQHWIGENNPNWIMDRTQLKSRHNRNFHDPEYKQWHREVKNRDNWKCRIADINCEGKLEAHHILPWSKFPELRYQTNNGITLCHFHHPRKMDEVKKLSPYFQQLVAEM